MPGISYSVNLLDQVLRDYQACGKHLGDPCVKGEASREKGRTQNSDEWGEWRAVIRM